MRYAPFLALGAILIGGTTLAQPPVPEVPPGLSAEIKASRAAVQQFSTTLKDALQTAIKNGGPVEGIAVCHDKAGQIATDLSTQLNMMVGRTSLKVRNPENAPDTWELAVLKQFEARKTQSEAVDTLEFSAVVTDDQGQKTFRYMKAIPTGTMCLSCHGTSIPPDVEAKLTALYPKDTARGFKEGDLRGAFTLAKPLP